MRGGRAKSHGAGGDTGLAAARGGHPVSFTPRGAGTPLGTWTLEFQYSRRVRPWWIGESSSPEKPLGWQGDPVGRWQGGRVTLLWTMVPGIHAYGRAAPEDLGSMVLGQLLGGHTPPAGCTGPTTTRRTPDGRCSAPPEPPNPLHSSSKGHTTQAPSPVLPQLLQLAMLPVAAQTWPRCLSA